LGRISIQFCRSGLAFCLSLRGGHGWRRAVKTSSAARNGSTPLVAWPPVRDLLLHAKHLFVEAMQIRQEIHRSDRRQKCQKRLRQRRKSQMWSILRAPRHRGPATGLGAGHRTPPSRRRDGATGAMRHYNGV
jgi:hypothetical protein